MCGIAGLWNASGDESPRAAVEAMLDAIAHRGPDGRGALEFAGGAAGMVRLALVDLSPRGQQPLWAADDRVAILFNGEMYNFREERARLAARGHRFQTTTDTEVVLALYLEHGLEFLDHVRGMYALAVFDWRDAGKDQPPTLVLGRDPFGIKPLYVTKRGPLVFASELRGMLASGHVDPAIDPEAVADYLELGFVLQPRSFLRGARVLEPGTLEVHRPSRAVERRAVWRLPPYLPKTETAPEAAERLREVLRTSVRLHALADAPVGAFLSGGVDSTGIVGMMREHVPALHTYTLFLPEHPGADESRFADAAARDFGCTSTLVEVTDASLPAFVSEFVSDLDQPSVDGFNTWLVSRAAARDVKAVLSGIGGDEWFAGYPVTRGMQRLAAREGPVLRVLGRLANGARKVVSDGVVDWELARLGAWQSMVARWARAHAVFPDDPSTRLIEVLDRAYPGWQRETPVGLSCLLDVRVFMGSRLLRDSDAVSMAHSLELRVPLVDREVAAFSRTCHDDRKLGPGRAAGGGYRDTGAKRVLIDALGPALPPGMADRAKRGFTLPIRAWLAGPLRALVEDTCSDATVRARGLVDPALSRAALHAPPRIGREAVARKLWALMVLELWCRDLDKRRSS